MLTPVPTVPTSALARQPEMTGTGTSGALAVRALSAVVEPGLDGAIHAATAIHYLFGRSAAALPVEVLLPELEEAPATEGDEGLCEDDRCGFVLRDGAGEAYNEDAFHYFLAVEHRRAQAAGRPTLMLLLEIGQPRGVAPGMPAATARSLFSILLRSLRDTDLVGWYRDGDIIGAVLTQYAGPTAVDLAEVVRARIARQFERELPRHIDRRLRLRLYSVSPNVDASK
jgi:hypothetical protein